MTFLEINAVHYHVEVKGQGPALVLLHGFSGSMQNWYHLADQLQSRFTTILIDIPGHGKSDKPPTAERYQIEQIAHDTATLIAQVSEAPVHLLGYSMGGRLALYLAVHYPELFKSLILESASPGIESLVEREARYIRDTELASQILHNGVEWFVDYWEGISLFSSQKTLPRAIFGLQRAQRLSNDPVGLANSLRGMGTGKQPSLWSALPRLTLPVLLIAGCLDEKYIRITRSMCSHLTRSEKALVADAGHNVHLEKPGMFYEMVNRFLMQL